MAAEPVILPLKTGTPELAVSRSPNPVPYTFINLNTSGDTYYIGYRSSINFAGSNTIPVEVGASVTITPPPNVPVYAIGLNGDSACLVPGGAGYSPGTLNVNAINSTVEVSGGTVTVEGVGGLFPPGNTASLYQNSSAALSIAPATDINLLTLQNVVNYNSLDINLSTAYISSAIAAGNATSVLLLVTFYDANGVAYSQRHINFPVGYNSLTGCGGTCSIPCEGSSVSIAIVNNGTAGTIVVPQNFLSICGNMRTIPAVKYWCSNVNTGAVNGFQYLTAVVENSAQAADTWIGAINNPTLTVGDDYLWPLSGFAGPATGWWRPNGTAYEIAIIDLGACVTLANVQTSLDAVLPILWVNPLSTSGDVETFGPIFLPPSPCCVMLESTVVTGDSLNFAMFGQSY